MSSAKKKSKLEEKAEAAAAMQEDIDSFEPAFDEGGDENYDEFAPVDISGLGE